MTRCEGNQARSFERVIRWHLCRYPHMQSADLVKLAFQAAFGNRHLGVDADSIRVDIENELASRRTEWRTGRLFEPLSPQTATGWVRVNLDAWKNLGGTARELADVILAGEVGTPDVRQRFHGFLGELETVTRHENFALPGKPLRVWADLLEHSGYPPVHHSHAYIQHYHPAYRVTYFPFLCRHAGLDPVQAAKNVEDSSEQAESRYQ